MAKGKTTSDHQKALYKAYQNTNRWERNKRRKIERHLKAFPNDKCASTALERGFTYSRKSSKTQVWSHSDKATATLFREFGRSGGEVLIMKKERQARDRRQTADD